MHEVHWFTNKVDVPLHLATWSAPELPKFLVSPTYTHIQTGALLLFQTSVSQNFLDPSPVDIKPMMLCSIANRVLTNTGCVSSYLFTTLWLQCLFKSPSLVPVQLHPLPVKCSMVTRVQSLIGVYN